MNKLLFPCLFLGILLSGCFPNPKPPTPSSGTADFSTTVSLGGSIMAGYANGALNSEHQSHSLAALIAGQMKEAGGGDFMQPLIPDGGGFGLNVKPWESLFQTSSQMGDRTDCLGEVSLGPVKSTFGLSEAANYLSSLPAGTYHNLAAPYATVNDYSSTSPGYAFDLVEPNPYYARFASNPGTSTPLDDAIAANPTFFFLWPGLQDIFNAAASGGTLAAQDAALFQQDLNNALLRLTASGAKGVLATLPYIENFPFFTTIPARALELTQSRADSLNDIYAFGQIDIGFVEGMNGFVTADSTIQGGARQLTADEFLLLTLPLDSVKCQAVGVLGQPMPDRYTLVESEITVLNAMVDAYNSSIQALATQYGLAIADLHSYLGNLKSGIVVDAVDFNADFATGNFYSLDGFTPTPKGAGLLANEFISAINDQYDSSIPPVRIDVLDGVFFP